MKLFQIPIGQFSSFAAWPPRQGEALKPRKTDMSKINQFAIPAFALAGILSIGSVVGLAQTNAPSDQTGKAAEPAAPAMAP